eukprot:PhM_4_TR18984/c0_g3_i1/m.82993
MTKASDTTSKSLAEQKKIDDKARREFRRQLERRRVLCVDGAALAGDLRIPCELCGAEVVYGKFVPHRLRCVEKMTSTTMSAVVRGVEESHVKTRRMTRAASSRRGEQKGDPTSTVDVVTIDVVPAATAAENKNKKNCNDDRHDDDGASIAERIKSRRKH